MKGLIVFVGFAFALLAGCSSLNNVNGQSAGYRSLPTAAGRASPGKSTGIQLVRGTQLRPNYILFLRKGYVAVGYSLFQSLSADGREVTAIARKENANLATAYKVRKDVSQIDLPTISPTANEAVKKMAANQMSLKVNGYNYVVIYWAPAAPRPFGAYLSDLPPQAPDAIGVNRGAYVNTVINNTPANNANIVSGDVILAINNININDASDAYSILNRDTGRVILIKVWHNGQARTKVIKLGDMGQSLIDKSQLHDLVGKWNGKIYPIPDSQVTLDVENNGKLSGIVKFNGAECKVSGQISQAAKDIDLYAVTLYAHGSNTALDSGKCLGRIRGFGYEDNRNLDNLTAKSRGNYFYIQYPLNKSSPGFMVFDLYRGDQPGGQ